METNDSVNARVEGVVLDQEVEATEAETVAEKPPIVETLEAKKARLERQLKKTKQQLGITDEEAENTKDAKTPFKLGYEHKAYLNANGIKGPEEYALVSEFVSNTGKELEEIVDSKYFQSELKQLREMKESKLASDATSGGKRGGGSARDTVEYWLNKGPDELPPSYMTQLRREVIAARIKTVSNNSPFKNN